MCGPDFRRKIRVDVVQGHGREFFPGIFQHPAYRIVDMKKPGVRPDPEESFNRMVDGELSQLKRCLGLPQQGDVFVQHNSAEDHAVLVVDRNGRIANDLLRPIETFEVKSFAQRWDTCREYLAQGPAMGLVDCSDGLPPTSLVVLSLQPNLFDVRPNLFRSRVCEERLARSIGKPHTHGKGIKDGPQLVLALGKGLLDLLLFRDIDMGAGHAIRFPFGIGK